MFNSARALANLQVDLAENSLPEIFLRAGLEAKRYELRIASGLL
jgi:hypothetical protein